MKKLFLLLLSSLVLVGNFTFAYNLTQKDEIIIEQLTEKIESMITERGEAYRGRFVKILDVFSIKYKNSNPRFAMMLGETTKRINHSNEKKNDCNKIYIAKDIKIPNQIVSVGEYYRIFQNTIFACGTDSFGEKCLDKDFLLSHSQDFEITAIDFESFEICESNKENSVYGNIGGYFYYAKDRDHVFRGKTIIDGGDVETFESLNFFRSKDKNHIYYCGEILE